MKIKIKVRRTADDELGQLSSSLSAQIVASIDDLLTEILLRLPMESLLRFKLVSKHWHSLITNPQFCVERNPNPNPAIGLFLQHDSDTHLNPSYTYVSLSVNKSSINPQFQKLNFTKDLSGGIRILQSCKGLLLCSTFRARGYNPRYYVYNPTTRRFSKLPKLVETHWSSTTVIHGMSLAFDPSKSPHYKVVCVRGLKSNSGEYQYQFEIYSSDKGPWRKCGEPFAAKVNFEKGVYWNGAIHWLCNEGGDSLYLNVLDNDGDDEKEMRPQTFPMPPIPTGNWDWRSNHYFGECCDHLHYIEMFSGGLQPQIQFDVYEMTRDYSEWFVKYQVDLSPLVASYPDAYPMDWYYFPFPIFAVVRGEKLDEDSFLVLRVPGYVVRYNLVSGTWETILDYFKSVEAGVIENGYQYIESLCCV